MPSLLSHLDLTPEQARRLPAKARTRLLHFLLRWEAYDDVLACLEEDGDLARLVSLQDLQAQALSGLGRHREALRVMGARRGRQKPSQSADLLWGRLHLAAGDLEAAEAIALRLIEANGPVQSLDLLGEVHLQQGHLDAAESAFLQHARRTPRSRAPLFGLMQVHYRRGDLVGAAAYAVRAYSAEEVEPAVRLIRDLRQWFERLGDANRVRDANRRLRQRFQAELAEMRALAVAPAGQESDRRRRPRVPIPKETPPSDLPAIAPATPLTEVPVSAHERSAIVAAARRLFGFNDLLPAQAEIIACVRRGEHVLAVLPTGGGKSLCYKLPAFLDEGATVVISPLIALMKDQVDKLPANLRGRAIAVNSSIADSALRAALAEIAAGRFDLIYAAPERLRQPGFLFALKRGGVARLVIDEAHCVSIWGHDFRPDYLAITQAHAEMGSPPILALTATAPPRVRLDIEQRLFGRASAGPARGGMRVIMADTYRANLQLSAIPTRDDDDKRRSLLHLCNDLAGSGIVYARTRRQCEELAGMLRQEGHDARHYHAGLRQRTLVQDRFMRGETRIIVSTIAFGMGIDKADIRFIIHYGLPDSVESYYQEAGRAGRDGGPAHCILLHSAGDRARLRRWANRSLIDKAYLRRAYAAVQGQASGRQPGSVEMAALKEETASDGTRLRVALSVLEQAGLLRRHQDAPARVRLQLEDGVTARALQRFAQAASLASQRSLDFDYMQLSDLSRIPARRLEWQLLEWQAAGQLTFSTRGRRLLISLLAPPADVAGRIDSLISRYAAIQRQRLAEIVDYARAQDCRHGYLAAYLGGQPRRRCQACDNCTGDVPGAGNKVELPAAPEQMRQILSGLSKGGWGRRNLIRILHGEGELPERARDNPALGQLAYRSGAEIDRLIDRLIRHGLIAEEELSHGGLALALTPGGRQALRQAGALARLIQE